MTAEEIYIKLKDELTAENESSSSPERIFIKSDGQTICTLGMNRSHEIIFVEFKPSPKDLPLTEREAFVHPHPVEMLHDAGWRQAQLTNWEEAEKLLEIIQRSYKRKKPKPAEVMTMAKRKKRPVAILVRAKPEEPLRPVERPVPEKGKPKKEIPMKAKPQPSKAKVKKTAKSKPATKAKPKAKPKPKLKVKAKPKAAPKKKASKPIAKKKGKARKR